MHLLTEGGIDRLTLTGKFDCQNSCDYLRQMLYQSEGFRLNSFGMFKYSLKITGSDNEDFSALLQWGGDMYNIKLSWRLEISPKNFNPYIKSIMNKLYFLSTINHLPKITRIDIAVDILKNINELEIIYKKMGKWSIWGNGLQIETKNYGSRSSENYFRFYDKALEQGINGNVTRFEKEDKKGYSLEEIKEVDFENIFDDFIIIEKDSLEDVVRDREDFDIIDIALFDYLNKNPLKYSGLTRRQKERYKRAKEIFALSEGKEIDIKPNNIIIQYELMNIINWCGVYDYCL